MIAASIQKWEFLFWEDVYVDSGYVGAFMLKLRGISTQNVETRPLLAEQLLWSTSKWWHKIGEWSGCSSRVGGVFLVQAFEAVVMKLVW